MVFLLKKSKKKKRKKRCFSTQQITFLPTTIGILTNCTNQCNFLNKEASIYSQESIFSEEVLTEEVNLIQIWL